MLFTLTGSSGSGKSTLARVLANRVPGLAVHDFDEVGVPDHPDQVWRNRTMQRWVRRALAYQHEGIDLLLSGQSPLGEVLACPSAPELDGIAVCLVDVVDELRRDRLARRPDAPRSVRHLDALLGWAEWHRGHARDPRHLPEAITSRSWPDMAWERWSGWTAGDPRWHTHVLDTSTESVGESAGQLADWIDAQRAACRAGRLPLGNGWTGYQVGRE